MPSDREQLNVRLAPGYGDFIERLRAAMTPALAGAQPATATSVVHAALNALGGLLGVEPPRPAGETRGRPKSRKPAGKGRKPKGDKP